MKGFISYRFTGENEQDLKNLILPIKNKLEEIGIDAYCNLFDPDFPERSKNFKLEDHVFDAFKILDTTELIFVLIMSENKSEGMLMEVGYGIAKNIPVIVAVKDDVKNTYLPGMAKSIIHFSDIPDLLEKISKIDIKQIL